MGTMSDQKPEYEFTLEDPNTNDKACMVSLIGETESGKTYSGIKLILGAVQEKPGLAVVISTSKGQAEHYGSLGNFKVMTFQPPHTMRRAYTAVRDAIAQGATAILFDCQTEVWDTVNQRQLTLLKEQEKLGRKNPGQLAWGIVKQECKGYRRSLRAFGGQALLVMTYWANCKVMAQRQPNAFYPLADKEMLRHSEAKILLTASTQVAGLPVWPTIKQDSLFRCREYVKGAFPSNVPLDEETGRALARWMRGEDCYREDAKR